MSDKHKLSAPSDWHEAFAALPMEHPPGDGWQRLAGARGPQRPARRRVLPWAAAATAACLAALPGLILLRSPSPGGTVAGATAATAPAIEASAGATDDGRASAESPPAVDAAGTASLVTLPEPSIAGTPRVARAVTSAAGADRPDAALERLYAESAHLEDLLGRVREPRVTNAGMEAATQQLAGTVGAIDTALADASLDAQGRQALWRERNALLEQMLTLELQHDLLSQQAIAPFDFAQIN